ncbi:trans-aconitate 2-methyltransferase [Microbacterium sp. MPKO10]|uniref:class I SAM-dependent methyltransferase n=1 Tax=Microbacterium sp. MPKO10 TaxID=2989818 RepID=UPI002236B1B3|nr:class I SAM-dependent methyltransferase [Microbacterium sp. MPKO10]MCW4457859.1 class I SAM-dependent methyltransferase [Microbacterium sp. MPKO10]
MTTTPFDWDAYYEAMSGRPLRKNLVAALEHWGDRPPGNAVDLGAGDGLETRELASRGWQVTAIDGHADLSTQLAGVEGVVAQHADFAQITELPASDLVVAAFSLPFCPPAHFDPLWGAIRTCLRPGGILAVEFFGVRDKWAGTPGMTFHTHNDVERMLWGLETLLLDEDERDGRAFDGPKHWHVFHVIARCPEGERHSPEPSTD